jgi:hypothetical protein
MDEPTTTVNVKHMPVAAWKRAGDRARANDETLGSWVSRAINQLANLEEQGDRLILPGRPATPPPAGRDAAELVPLMQGVAAMLREAAGHAAASGRPIPPGMAKEVHAAMRDLSREARGLPAIRRVKRRPEIGYTGPLIEAALSRS